MGTYLNPGNQAFRQIAGPDYVDKTGLIELINRRIDGDNNLVCISRPRRFGKSYAAKMLTAYYDCSCDSHELFDNKKIAEMVDYSDHINQYNVICIDVSGFISEAKLKNESLRVVPIQIVEALKKEINEQANELNDTLLQLVETTKKKIIFIIDEWDAMIREAKDDEVAQQSYLNLLRGWFKNLNFTPKAVGAAYITGILPIKKDGSQSAISDFKEYSVLNSGAFAEYIGFTEDEVREICDRERLEFEEAKRWYDGYTVGDMSSIYNPYSIREAADRGKFTSYWKQTSAADALKTYIDMDQDGLQRDIVSLIAGEHIEVKTGSFRNDFENFTSKDDVLTLLIHLGYLTYEEDDDNSGVAFIPNEEVRTEFDSILRKAEHKDLIELVRRSDELLKKTLAGDSDAVAAAIAKVRNTSYAPTYYNNEQALRYAIKMAYISCVDQYARVEELPSGHGLADVAYLPKRRSALPAMVVELKWSKDAEGAISQMKNRNYSSIPAALAGEVVLVGINYDESTKAHSCKIERVRVAW